MKIEVLLAKNKKLFLASVLLFHIGAVGAVGVFMFFKKNTRSEFKEKEQSLLSNQKLNTIHEKELFLHSALNKDFGFVIFWAQWCAPCIEEIKELSSLQKNKDKIIFVNIDKISLKEFKNHYSNLVNEHKINFQSYFDRNYFFPENLKIHTLPASIYYEGSSFKIVKVYESALKKSYVQKKLAQ